jgi:hypothetical protein
MMDNRDPNQESRDSQQAKRSEDQELLRRERQVRGDMRNAHLEAGRERARSDSALVKASDASAPVPEEATPDQMSDDEHEATLRARKEAGRAAMKAEARSRYDGSGEDFERDWPDIREQLITQTMEEDLKQNRRGL